MSGGKRLQPGGLPGPSPQASRARLDDDSRIPRSVVPRILPAEALAAAAAAALDRIPAPAADEDEVVEINAAEVTLSRRDSARLRLSGEFQKFDFYSTSKVK